MFNKGTIVLVPFPFTDLSGNKVRPALIVSKGKVGSDVIVVFITSQSKLRAKYLVYLVPDAENGLKAASKIVCSKLATLDSKVVLGEIGKLSKTSQREVDSVLKEMLGL